MVSACYPSGRGLLNRKANDMLIAIALFALLGIIVVIDATCPRSVKQ